MNKEDYKFVVDIVLNLKTDIVKDNLIKVIRALKYGEWVKTKNHCVTNDYKGVKISINFDKKEIFVYDPPCLNFVFNDKGKVGLMKDENIPVDRAIWWDYIEYAEGVFNSRDVLEVENTSKLVGKLLAVAAEKKDFKTKKDVFKLAEDMLPDLKTDLVRETLAKVIRVLKTNKWDKWDSYFN